MAYAGKGNHEQVKKLREYAEALGIKTLFSSDNSIIDLDIRAKYLPQTIDDFKWVPISLKRKVFTSDGRLRKQAKAVIESLFNKGAVYPEKTYEHPSIIYKENISSYLEQIGLLDHQKYNTPTGGHPTVKHRILNPGLAKILLSDDFRLLAKNR